MIVLIVLKIPLGLLPRLHASLKDAGILTEDLAIPDNPYDLEATYRGLCRLPNEPTSKRRRIDILSVPWKSRGAALLYYTVRRLLLALFHCLTTVCGHRAMILCVSGYGHSIVLLTAYIISSIEHLDTRLRRWATRSTSEDFTRASSEIQRIEC
jgi:hypothetical protein